MTSQEKVQQRFTSLNTDKLKLVGMAVLTMREFVGLLTQMGATYHVRTLDEMIQFVTTNSGVTLNTEEMTELRRFFAS